MVKFSVYLNRHVFEMLNQDATPTPIFSQSDYFIKVVDKNSHAEWQTVQIQIRWLLRSQLIWIYTVYKGRAYPGSAGLGLTLEINFCDFLNPFWTGCTLKQERTCSYGEVVSPEIVSIPLYRTLFYITKTRLFKYIENFATKNWKFSDKNILMFFIFLIQT